jgi:hypothetical protein
MTAAHIYSVFAGREADRAAEYEELRHAKEKAEQKRKMKKQRRSND